MTGQARIPLAGSFAGRIDSPSAFMEGESMTDAEAVTQRVRRIRAIRRSAELEGARSTDATRADQVAYARGEIDVNALAERVRRRYNLA